MDETKQSLANMRPIVSLAVMLFLVDTGIEFSNIYYAHIEKNPGIDLTLETGRKRENGILHKKWHSYL